MVAFVVRGWTGKERLWKVAWLGYVGGVLLLVVVAMFLYTTFGNASPWIFSPAVAMINIWGFVAIWRCASNAAWSGWFYIARVVVAIAAIGWLLDVLKIVE